ncbi:hypothetical protein RJT34_32901 [Clitoria ternatea]|uniref:Xyloglucan endotransglucosylase/hydrolase n=1 Tax=Clitoria ternatea TaxID=43366 RepID=A0AAN9I2R5_CLITE
MSLHLSGFIPTYLPIISSIFFSVIFSWHLLNFYKKDFKIIPYHYTIFSAVQFPLHPTNQLLLFKHIPYPSLTPINWKRRPICILIHCAQNTITVTLHRPMASFSSAPFANALFGLLIAFLFSTLSMVAFAGNLYEEVDITWGDGRGKILNNGELLTLSLDSYSGSGFQSKNQYLYGKLDMQIKLVPGNSAGTVTAYYLRSEGTSWGEIDFEFLGNLSDNPYIVHTNVYTQGKGDREEQFYLWFDPTADFHTYSFLWNPSHIVFYVDGRPIREFKNLEGVGVPYPKEQPMRLYSSLWNADNWATRGGLVKTNWSQAPFTVSFSNFRAKGCVWTNEASLCSSNSSNEAWLSRQLDAANQKRLKWVQKNFRIYNYCADFKRFPQGLPLECTIRSKS